MFKKYNFLFATIFFSFFTACGQNPPDASQIDGYYEETTKSAMERFKGRQAAVPEYRPSRGVIVSSPLLTYLRREDMARAILDAGVDTLWIAVSPNFRGSLANTEFRALREALGDRMNRVQLLRQSGQGAVSLWARDWAPLSAHDSDGALRALDFNYWGSKADDSAGLSLSQALRIERVSIPVANEGGNFMNNGQGHCLMTTRVIEANPDMSQIEIEGYHQAYAGCRQVTILPRLPYEATGHIDMWAKFVDDRTILVNELRDELLSLYAEVDRSKALDVQKFLDEQARELSKMGYGIIRLPMPGPIFSPFINTFRSYSNSLIVNGSVLVPEFRKPVDYLATGNDLYFDERYREAYEREVRGIYEGLGFHFVSIDSDRLITLAGAVHCASMQIARERSDPAASQRVDKRF